MSERFPKYYQRTETLKQLEAENPLKKMLRSFLEYFEAHQQKKCHIFEISDFVPQFSLSDELARRSGPMLEVGGPTEWGFRMVPTEAMKELQNRYTISNRDDGMYQFVGRKDRQKKMYDVDLSVDAGNLPFADSALSAVFASCLPRDAYERHDEKSTPVRAPAIREAHRALENGGLLIWQGAFWDDLRTAQSLGFEMVAHTWGRLTGEEYTALLERSGFESGRLRDLEWMHTTLKEIRRDDPRYISQEVGFNFCEQAAAPYYIVWRKTHTGGSE